MKSAVTLRPWTTDDTRFACKVRNHPDIMCWFRQDEPLTEDAQWYFIENDVYKNSGYKGRIIEYKGKPVGLCGIKTSREFTIGLLPEYQGQGIAKKAMELLLKDKHGVWSEVFVGNPALEFFIAKCGFRITEVKERAYYKKGKGLVDVVTIRHDNKPNTR